MFFDVLVQLLFFGIRSGRLTAEPYVCMYVCVCVCIYIYIYIQGVSGGIVNILGGGSIDYSE